jgi:hypothetical protein
LKAPHFCLHDYALGFVWHAYTTFIQVFFRSRYSIMVKTVEG